MRNKYMLIVFMYEQKINNPSDAKVFKVENIPFDFLPERVEAFNSMELKTEMLIGIFWPRNVWKAPIYFRSGPK